MIKLTHLNWLTGQEEASPLYLKASEIRWMEWQVRSRGLPGEMQVVSGTHIAIPDYSFTVKESPDDILAMMRGLE